MPATPPLDGPPPSPATNPAAAQEAGQPMPISGLAPKMPLNQQGNDMSGVLGLGQKISEGMLAMAQMAPDIADDLGQARAMFMAALARYTSGANKPPDQGSMPSKGAVVTQAGPQFPAGGQGAGKPY